MQLIFSYLQFALSIYVHNTIFKKFSPRSSSRTNNFEYIYCDFVFHFSWSSLLTSTRNEHEDVDVSWWSNSFPIQ